MKLKKEVFHGAETPETIISCVYRLPTKCDKTFMFYGVGENHGAAETSMIYLGIKHLCGKAINEPRVMMTSRGRVIEVDEAMKIYKNLGCKVQYDENQENAFCSANFDKAFFDIKKAYSIADAHNKEIKKIIAPGLSMADRWEARQPGD
jgi:hypothetical protein